MSRSLCCAIHLLERSYGCTSFALPREFAVSVDVASSACERPARASEHDLVVDAGDDVPGLGDHWEVAKPEASLAVQVVSKRYLRVP